MTDKKHTKKENEKPRTENRINYVLKTKSDNSSQLNNKSRSNMSSESERESASSGTLDTRVMFPLILAWF